MSTCLLAKLALGAVAAVALAGGPSEAPLAQPAAERGSVVVTVGGDAG